ncbi:MAG: ABC transporter ATP-binding protein [Planctomyces sp.]|nr:ABC transporter ATP-binding protein [Planctomyces sp.]
MGEPCLSEICCCPQLKKKSLMSELTKDTIPAISVSQLSHSFKGHQALNQVTFCVLPGTIHGFVGPNGAGKTTTLKVICTLLKPNWGEVSVFGHSVRGDTAAVRRMIGYMPDHFSMYRQMTVYEYLDFFAAAYGLGVTQRDQVITDVLTLTDMDVRRNDLINGLSRGMQQRVSLARVLVHDPNLLLLDEPASGLDPRARIELMEILRELRRMGKTIFISSHILSELAELCDSVTIIDRGQVRFSGPIDHLLDNSQDHPTYNLKLADVIPDVLPKLKALPGVEEATEPEFVTGRDFILQLSPSTTANEILRSLLSLEIPIVAFSQQRRQLNQAFMDLTTRGVRS